VGTKLQNAPTSLTISGSSVPDRSFHSLHNTLFPPDMLLWILNFILALSSFNLIEIYSMPHLLAGEGER
jgi:hypothetical protein